MSIEHKFEVGKVYACRSIGDSNCIWQYVVTRRTAKSVWIAEVVSDWPETSVKRLQLGMSAKRKLISVYNGEEQCKPHGSYSMAAILGAERCTDSDQVRKWFARRAEEWKPKPQTTNGGLHSRMAEAFAKGLRDEIGSDNYAATVAANETEPNKQVCHSHDYCDANEVMAAVFVSFFGRESRADSEADAADWNAAWDAWRRAEESKPTTTGTRRIAHLLRLVNTIITKEESND